MPRTKELPDLVNFNTKVQPADLELIRALTEVGPHASQRELIEAMLRDYKVKYPETFSKAERYLEFMKGV